LEHSSRVCNSTKPCKVVAPLASSASKNGDSLAAMMDVESREIAPQQPVIPLKSNGSMNHREYHIYDDTLPLTHCQEAHLYDEVADFREAFGGGITASQQLIASPKIVTYAIEQRLGNLTTSSVVCPPLKTGSGISMGIRGKANFAIGNKMPVNDSESDDEIGIPSVKGI